MIEEELFHRALEKPTFAEQMAFLDDACAGHPKLRQHVERLLRSHRQDDSFLHAEFSIAEPTSVRPGLSVGPYKLLEQIGEGGMGTVWMAQQMEPVKRVVALKLIKAGMDSKQVIARFNAERQALALMDHPNIAKVLDAGTTSAGRPYFVMDLVKGVPITRYCDEHQLTPRERLELFVPVCQAIQHAHQKGVIHRDIKPSNVLVALYDGRPVPKVIDFGVAKAAGHLLTDKTLVTGFGAIVGTLEYMSPEQAEINQLDIDTRSDIYSLGVLLYELLTGSPPFRRKDLEIPGIMEMLRVIREQEPTRPSTKLSTDDGLLTLAANRGTEPARLTKLMRGDLDWIVMKALEKDRNRRYETANSFAMDVQRHLADEPVEACPPSVAYRMRKFARRNKLVLGAVALLALTVTVVAGAVVENFRREVKAREEARERVLEKEKDEAIKQLDLTRQFAKTESVVSEALARSSALADQAATMPTATGKEAAAAVATLQQADAAVTQAEAALVAGKAEQFVYDKVQSARINLDRMRNQADQQLAQVLREEKLRSDLDEANTARPSMAGDQIGAAAASELFEKAFKHYGLDMQPGRAEALAKRIRAEKPDVRDAMIAGLDNWGFVVATAKSAMPSAELIKIARAADDDPWRTAYRDAVANKDAETLTSLAKKARKQTVPPVSVCLLALSLTNQGQRGAAVDLLRWARNEHPKDIWIPFLLAVTLDTGIRQTPAAVIEEQIGCYRLFLAQRPDSPSILNNLGSCLCRRGSVDESITCLRAALKLKPDYPLAFSNLGISLKDKGLLDDALVAFDEAIRLRPDSANYHSNWGLTLLEKGLTDKAVAALEKAVKLNPELATAHSNLGNALRKKRMFKEAIAACDTAIRLDPNLAAAHVNLGVILAEQEKNDEAMVAFKNAIRVDSRFTSAYWNLAQAQCAKNLPAEAEKNARKAIELEPNLAYAHDALGVALSFQDKNVDAIASFKEAVRHKPDFADGHFNLGQMYYRLKQFDNTLAAMEQAIKHDPKHARAHYQIGWILADRKKHSEAIKFFQKAASFQENYAEAYYHIGLSQRALNDLNAAMESFQTALRLDSKHAESHFYVGMIHEQRKRLDDAIASYRESIRLKSDFPQAHYNLGTLLADKQQFAAAADAFRHAIKLNKDYAKAHNNLGAVLAQQGKVADAIPCFREALRCDPKYALAQGLLAQALNVEAWPLVVPINASRTDAQRAVKMAREATLLDPKVPEYWNTLGLGHYRTGNWDDAITALKKSSSMSKQNDWCDFLVLAMAHWKKGDKEDARTWYDRGVARIKAQKVDTDESRRFQMEAAALLGLAKKEL